MSWPETVQTINGLGFSKVTVIRRKNFKVCANTSIADVATSYTNKKGKKINENQELLDDWSDKSTFNFYGIEFAIKNKDTKHIVGSNGDGIIVAYQFKSVWIVAYGSSKNKKLKSYPYIYIYIFTHEYVS